MLAGIQESQTHQVDDIGFLEPYARAFTSSGVAYPSDLAMLKSVYDLVCKEQGLPPGSREAANLSSIAMHLFSQGICDPDILYRELQGF